MLELLSIGDLVEPGTYDFLNGFRHVINFTDGRRIVSLALPPSATIAFTARPPPA